MVAGDFLVAQEQTGEGLLTYILLSHLSPKVASVETMRSRPRKCKAPSIVGPTLRKRVARSM